MGVVGVPAVIGYFLTKLFLFSEVSKQECQENRKPPGHQHIANPNSLQRFEEIGADSCIQLVLRGGVATVAPHIENGIPV